MKKLARAAVVLVALSMPLVGGTEAASAAECIVNIDGLCVEDTGPICTEFTPCIRSVCGIVQCPLP